MKNFDWTQFNRKIAISTPLKTVYDAWTIPSEIEKWFLKDASFYDKSGAKIDKSDHIVSGNTYSWQWYVWDGTETGVVRAANGKDHIQFTFAGDCIVDVTLKPHGEFTLVFIKQSNIPTNDEAKQNIRLGCDSGWSFYIVNLKSVYEGGIDLRNKNKELGMMLNN